MRISYLYHKNISNKKKFAFLITSGKMFMKIFNKIFVRLLIQLFFSRTANDLQHNNNENVIKFNITFAYLFTHSYTISRSRRINKMYIYVYIIKITALLSSFYIRLSLCVILFKCIVCFYREKYVYL